MSKNKKTDTREENLPDTEQSPAEKALASSELRYRRLFETAKDGILILDAETGIVVDVNPFLLDLLDYPYEEFVGKAIWELGFFKDIVDNQNNFAELQRQEYIRYENKPLETAAGRLIEVEFVSNVYLVDGKKVIQCNIRDNTEHKRAALALRESEERYHSLYMESKDAILMVSPEKGFFAGGNPAAIKLYGCRDEQDLTNRTPESLSPEYQPDGAASAVKAQEMMRLALETGSHFFEWTHRRKDGTDFPATVLLSRLEIDGQPILLATVRDITEQRRMETQLWQTLKMEAVGRLAGGVAHDFSNMLGVILGYADMALNQVSKDQPLYDNLQEIKNAAKCSADLTRQLLAFARKQTIEPVELNLNDAVENLFNMLRRLIGEDVNLVWQPGTGLHTVRLDPSQIDQILVNLCINARDAIPDTGKIILKTGNISVDESYCAGHADAVPGEYVFLEISDDGSGMSAETLAHIFEPFFTTKDISKGTGLGLATVYGIVKQNNGFIYAYSEPGVGTTFRIYLPQIAKEVVQPSVIRATEAPEAKGETVLLVEDEPSLRRIYTLFLEELGYNVLSSETPEKALELSAQPTAEIHLLLTDVVMPRMNGQQMADLIRAEKPGIKVLFMSGYTTNVLSDHGVVDQNKAFISKPFTRDALGRKIRAVLEAKDPETLSQ